MRHFAAALLPPWPLLRHGHSDIILWSMPTAPSRSDMPATPLTLTASAVNLKRLTSIRTILIVALLASLAYVRSATGSDLVNPTHLTVPAMLALLNILTLWRLQKPWPVTDGEYFGQLLFDVLALSAILFLSGGATNPFISYFLVPITVAAALLPRALTWIIAASALAAYTLLLFFYRPLPILQMHGGGHSADLNLHIFGMWITFALSTLLITHFVTRMAEALRDRERQLAAQREDKLHNEQVLAIATLAAGTAHELGTPLSTMTILLDEIAATHDGDKDLIDDIAMLSSQLQHCKQTLSRLVATADVHSHYQRRAQPVGAYLRGVVDRWSLLRPEAVLAIDISADTKHRQILVDPTLEQALANLLNNAADAAVGSIQLSATTAGQQLVINIQDDGPGIPLALLDSIGKPFVTTKDGGMGLGLFLSHATIERCGGEITLRNGPQGGTVAEIRLPIHRSEVP